MHISG
jgi:hypothetical protein